MKYLFINSVAGFGSTGRIAAETCRELMGQGHQCVLAFGRMEAACPDVPTVRIGSPWDCRFHGLRSRLLEKQLEQRMQEEAALKGETKKIEWGSQIRSYVFCPYTLVKDHRTGYEMGDVQAVMDGDIQGFIIDYLKKS